MNGKKTENADKKKMEVKPSEFANLLRIRRFSLTLYPTRFVRKAFRKDFASQGRLCAYLFVLLLGLSFYPKAYGYPPEILAIVGEASGEGYHGMLAVGEVLHRRGSVKGFYGFKADHVKKEPQWVFKQAERAWRESSRSNLTKGATHFESSDFPRPKWAKSMRVTAKIGKHIFYASK